MSVLVLFAGASFGDVVLMEDNFNGTAGVSIPGSAPGTLHSELTGRIWEGSTAVQYDENGGMVGASGSYRAAAFDISGVYTATNTITIRAWVQNDKNKWAAIGFATTASATGDDIVGWVNIFGDAAGTPGSGALREGPSIEGGTSVTLATDLWNSETTNLVEIQYNLNDDGDGDGTIRAYVNGTLVATLADCSAIGMPDYVHLAFNNGGGTTAGGQFFDRVQVLRDSVIPKPAALG